MSKITEIVNVEKRLFSSKDFLLFDYDGMPYKFTPGTIRNYLAKLRKDRKIEFAYRSNYAFYTLPGVKMGKTITPYHTGGTYYDNSQVTYWKNRFLQFLLTIPMDKPGIHDILLNFTVKGLWEVIQLYPIELVQKVDLNNNKDIKLHRLDFGDHYIKITVHNTDNVSVRVACTRTPIPLDILGLGKLTSSLTRIEEGLQRVLDLYLEASLKSNIRSSSLLTNSTIPNYMSWMVNQWHFGQDALTTYSGEMFKITWKDSLGVFQIYSKLDASKKKLE